MADEKPTIQIDNDWKRQAQEEKKRLAEKEAARAAQEKSTPSPATAPTGAPDGAAPGAPATRGQRELPPASFTGLVQSLVTQVMLYLGQIPGRGGEPVVNLDMAKYQIDHLGVLEEKSRGNLTDEEKRMLDAALYETRMRFVAVAQDYLG